MLRSFYLHIATTEIVDNGRSYLQTAAAHEHVLLVQWPTQFLIHVRVHAVTKRETHSYRADVSQFPIWLVLIAPRNEILYRCHQFSSKQCSTVVNTGLKAACVYRFQLQFEKTFYSIHTACVLLNSKQWANEHACLRQAKCGTPDRAWACVLAPSQVWHSRPTSWTRWVGAGGICSASELFVKCRSIGFTSLHLEKRTNIFLTAYVIQYDHSVWP